MQFNTQKDVISYMLHLIRKSKISMKNLFNFYIEHTDHGYVLHTSKPTFKDEKKLENGLKFYLTNIRK